MQIMQIWEFPLSTIERQIVSMPKGAQILTIQVQGQIPYIWASVNPDSPVNESVVIETFGTWHQMPHGERRYIGTYQLHDGRLVFHVFAS